MTPKIAISDTAVLIVDHGSRLEKSNRRFSDLVAEYAKSSPCSIVEPAHMELAEPSLATAFGRCVERGARLVIIHPFFLLPGKHWELDIPNLANEAAKQYPDIPYVISPPLGPHPLLIRIIQDRVQQSIQNAKSAKGIVVE